MRRRRPALGPFLDQVVATYNHPRYLGTDPLSTLHRYADPRDQELVGFLAAGLAFGNVKAVIAAIDRALAPLGERPAERLARMDEAEAARAAAGFNHRWIFEQDLAQIYRLLGAVARRGGGLEPLFARGMTPDAPDVRPGARALVDGLTELALGLGLDLGRLGTRYFLSDPTGAGAAKRLHMFLRWMIRRDGLDLGLWTSATPAQLVVPLDTHVARLSGYLGLTRLKSPGGRMALDITESLRRLDPADPVKYDFALTRLGILRDCPPRRDVAKCARCALVEVCRKGARR